MTDPRPTPLSGLSTPELEDLLEAMGEQRYRGRQVFEQIHARLAPDFPAMTTLARTLRAALPAGGCTVHALTTATTRASTDGTVKLAFSAADGQVVESVLIPMDDGTSTQCLSSQAGCALACAFCKTGTMGLARNLTPAEILDQHLIAVRTFPDLKIKNLVLMGMGEPLMNLDHVIAAIRLLQDERGRHISPRRITVSTAGIVPGIERLGRETSVLLAVSLNAPTQELREKIMPVAASRYPLDQLVAALKAFPLPHRQRITVEYVLLPGMNDSLDQARDLVRLLSWLKCKVNLIPFNPWPGAPFGRPTEESVNRFRDFLLAKNFTVTVRASKGQDIEAACGQLAGRATPLSPQQIPTRDTPGSRPPPAGQ